MASEVRIRASRVSFEGWRWALPVVATAALSAQCSGLQAIPEHYPVQSPAGHDVKFQCAAAAPAPNHSTVLAFTRDLGNWPNREGAFRDGQPLLVRGVRAKDVRSPWSARQSELFPPRTAKEHRQSAVPIGGSYWQETLYPVVRDGEAPWVSSGFAAAPGAENALPAKRGNEPTGSMWAAFTLDAKYLRVEMGGDTDPSVGVELLVEPGGADLAGCPAIARAKDTPKVLGHENYVTVYVEHGSGREAVEAQSLATDSKGCSLLGRKAVLRIFDRSASAHVNIGAVELTDTPPDDATRIRRTPVWGFADFHTHPTSYLGFGGLQGIHTLWGVPGGAMKDYGDPDSRQAVENVSHDVPPCDDAHKPYNAHQGGFAAPIMINVSEGRLSQDIGDLSKPEWADMHASQGGPTYRDFPDFRKGAHQQYHITQIHRAYLGGLRLISALAIQNPGLEYGVGWVTCSRDGKPTVETSRDLDVIRAHVQAMKELARANGEWMQIAYTPDQARDIIRQNKLAVVLGVEVPELPSNDAEAVATQVDALKKLGIRQVVLVHGMDNELGGAALFNDLYNTVTDWMNRPRSFRDQVQPLSGELDAAPFGKASFFEVTTTPSPLRDAANDEEIRFRLTNPRRIVLSDLFPHPSYVTYNAPLGNVPYGSLHPFVNSIPVFVSERGIYDGYGAGHRNVRGLSEYGKEFLATLVQRGMLVDLAHMSDASVNDAYGVFDGHGCGSYPFVISHAHFRHLPFKGDYSDRAGAFVDRTSKYMRNDTPVTDCVHDHAKCIPAVLTEAMKTREGAPWLGPGSVSRGNLPNEFAIATSEADQLATRRGAIGVFLDQPAQDDAAFRTRSGGLPEPLQALPFANDCAGSSKSFATSLWYAEGRMPGTAIGVASDFALVSNVAPRFGPFACGAYLDVGAGSARATQLLETLLNPPQYRFAAQRAPVTYSSRTKTCPADRGNHHLGAVECGPNEPLDPYVMGERVYDFNVDGLAHFGLVPDMLQDVDNVLGGKAPSGVGLDRLFQSAEGYLETWERARTLSGCDHSGLCGTTEEPPEDLEACGDECLHSWNGGAPLQSVLDIDDNCALGSTIRFMGLDEAGKPREMKPIYAQHAANVREHPEGLSEQGDWGVFRIDTRPLWKCGNSAPAPLPCPPSANYVKVRRVLDATIGDVQNCNWLALAPEVGNRRVVFECLAGLPGVRGK